MKGPELLQTVEAEFRVNPLRGNPVRKTTAARQPAQVRKRRYDGNQVIGWEQMAGLWHPGLFQPKVIDEADDDIANMTDEELDRFCELVIAKYHEKLSLYRGGDV